MEEIRKYFIYHYKSVKRKKKKKKKLIQNFNIVTSDVQTMEENLKWEDA
jgi:hypothetical protein